MTYDQADKIYNLYQEADLVSDLIPLITAIRARDYRLERERVLDELVVAYDELAGERLDGLITQEVYLKRKLQLNYIAIDAGIGSPEIEREIAKRYRREGEGKR